MGREWLKTQRAPLLHPEMPSPHKKARHRSPTPPTSAAFPTPTTPKLLLPAPPATPMRLLGSSRLGEKTDTGDESQSRSPTNEDPVKTVKGVTAHDTGAEKDKDKRENLLKRGLESATDTGEGPSGDKAASVVAKVYLLLEL